MFLCCTRPFRLRLPGGTGPYRRLWPPDGAVHPWVLFGARRLRSVSGPGHDAGVSTAEYAVATVAACAFAFVLHQVVTSDAVGAALQRLIEQALSGQY